MTTLNRHSRYSALSFRAPRRQRGASLLEGIAYLGIAAIVVLGSVSLLTNAFGSAKSNQMSEEVTALRTVVRKLYAGQPYNDGTMLSNLVAAKAIPNTLVVNTSATPATVSNSWGGAVTITGSSAGAFQIAYNNVPKDVCMGVLSGANGWTKVSNGTTDVTQFPATAANAATVCNADPVALTFTAS